MARGDWERSGGERRYWNSAWYKSSRLSQQKREWVGMGKWKDGKKGGNEG